ncbi:hypothetical protein GGH95_006427 [Coemansia sp. RSA 1836]|nr:hypothetical protein GGH95_006427 [Coemansia sp. RSA 1836]
MESKVKALLDHREKDGYSIEFVSVFTKAGSVISGVMVYVGVSTNPSFASEEHESSIEHTARGPSGSNREYLYKLCDALRQHDGGVIDEYLVELERRVKEIE